METRRFFARPSAVALSAIGFSAPSPCAVMRSGATPLATSAFFTLSARACEIRCFSLLRFRRHR
jgi:hypothetical protein